MAWTTVLHTVAIFACFSAAALAVRESRFFQRPKLEMRKLSQPQDARSKSDTDCMLGLAGKVIGKTAYSTIYAFNKSEFPVMKEKYRVDPEAWLIFKDLGDHMMHTKQYVIKLNRLQPETGLREFEAQTEAAEIELAPEVAAGWVCYTKLHSDASLNVMVMERAGPSLWSLYAHLCNELTEDNKAEITRLAALAQRSVLGVLERLAQRGISHIHNYNSNFILDADGLVRAKDFEVAVLDAHFDEGHEARKLRNFRKSLQLVWLSTKNVLQCLDDELEDANSKASGSSPVLVGSPEDRRLKLLGLSPVLSLLKDPYGWATFDQFVNHPLGREPLVASLLK